MDEITKKYTVHGVMLLMPSIASKTRLRILVYIGFNNVKKRLEYLPAKGGGRDPLNNEASL